MSKRGADVQLVKDAEASSDGSFPVTGGPHRATAAQMAKRQ